MDPGNAISEVRKTLFYLSALVCALSITTNVQSRIVLLDEDFEGVNTSRGAVPIGTVAEGWEEVTGHLSNWTVRSGRSYGLDKVISNKGSGSLDRVARVLPALPVQATEIEISLDVHFIRSRNAGLEIHDSFGKPWLTISDSESTYRVRFFEPPGVRIDQVDFGTHTDGRVTYKCRVTGIDSTTARLSVSVTNSAGTFTSPIRTIAPVDAGSFRSLVLVSDDAPQGSFFDRIMVTVEAPALNLIGYTQEVSKRLAKRQYDDALSYTDEFIATLEGDIEILKSKVDTKLNASDLTAEQEVEKRRIEQSIRMSDAIHRAVNVFRADLRFVNKNLPQEEWIDVYRDLLRASHEDTRTALQLLSDLPLIFSDDQSQKMLVRELPPEIRSRLALGRWRNGTRSLHGASAHQVALFYENFLSTRATPMRLSAYYLNTCGPWIHSTGMTVPMEYSMSSSPFIPIPTSGLLRLACASAPMH